MDLPADANGGIYDLVISTDETQMKLGQIQVSDATHVYTLPADEIPSVDVVAGTSAHLVGYRLDSETVARGYPLANRLMSRLFG